MIRTALLGLGVALLVGASAPVQSAGRGKQTVGFVVTRWDLAVYETRFGDECPQGLAIGNDELWWRWLSRADKDRLTNGGLVQPVDRRFISVFRGPKGEDVCWNPEIVKDPPLRTVKGKTAYGFDLDGNVDGAPTAKSCKHETFTGVDGTPGVDNQLYRVMGCHYGWRHNGVLDSYDEEERRNSGRGVVLIEIAGADDLRNSADVTVTLYRAIDPFSIDAAGKILPYGSYRVDMSGDKARYARPMKGRIVDGVLTTEPRDLSLPSYGNNAYAEIRLRDMRLKLDLNAVDGKVSGLVGGYYDFDKWWEYMLKVEFLVATGDWSCPAVYEAAKRLADGYPDADGRCTAISSAFKVEAIPAFIVHQRATAKAE